MVAKKFAPGLGRGFDSLIPTQLNKELQQASKSVDTKTKAKEEDVRELPLGKVTPNPDQPRREFEQSAIDDLAASIKIHGIMQPLVVSKQSEGFIIIAGERRYRAAKQLGLKKVPVIVRKATAQQQLELALIENLQREDLRPLESAIAYQRLVDQFNLSPKEIGERVGKSVSAVKNTMRLLKLGEAAHAALTEGRISEGHARALLGLDKEEDQAHALDLVEKNGWNVRQTEHYVQSFGKSANESKAKARTQAENDYTRTLEAKLNTKVRVQATAKGGRLLIEYHNEDELAAIIKTLS